ncbi:MAG: hypothetical protein J6N72_06205 [Psychrobacter sp.]|nr:hypothetical protein [Psychrobacter sp.]
MQLETICKDPNISEESRFWIESALAPRFIASDSELYLIQYLIEVINDKAFVFSEADEKRLIELDKKATYIELPVDTLRQFLPR